MENAVPENTLHRSQLADEWLLSELRLTMEFLIELGYTEGGAVGWFPRHCFGSDKIIFTGHRWHLFRNKKELTTGNKGSMGRVAD